jgi:hypothetical protein
VRVEGIQEVEGRRTGPDLALQFDILDDVGRGKSGRADAEKILGPLLVEQFFE